MIRELIYIVEIFSVLKCIHCVYDEKQKINVGYVMTVIALFVTVEIANKHLIALEGTFLMYSILSVYCVLTFKRMAKVYVINTAFYMIISTVIQLICCGLAILLQIEDRFFRILAADVFTLLCCYFILPGFKVYKLANWAERKNWTLYISVGYVFLIVCDLIIKIKADGGARVGTYLTLIPFIFCVYILSKQWRMYQDSYEQEKKELQLYRDDKQKFDGIVSKIRSRQHEINNHITAIMSLHYTSGTYEELVEKQNAYCKHIIGENKFNSLLRLYNSVLPGFLMDKFTQIETAGISVECKVLTEQYKSLIPEYYLIEMLGILLDNAAEAAQEEDSIGRISFKIIQTNSGYEYVVSNPYKYVSYEDFGTWFAYEKSSKGTGRGIGLYHLKCLCDEWKCTLTYRNVEYDNLNWIEIKVGTGRKI